MLALGITGGFKGEDESDPAGYARHDAAAVLLEDSRLVCAIEEERLSRIKHSNCFPTRAIQFCLSERGVDLDDIDRIAINTAEDHADRFAQIGLLAGAQPGTPTTGREFYASLFRRRFGREVGERLYFCHHHAAHAWSAFLPSGFDCSLVLSIDGEGDNCSGMVFVARAGGMELIRTLPMQQSLGHLYQQLSRVLGYDRFDEYKVMGLAPYGDPSTYAAIFEESCRLTDEGNFWLPDSHAWFARLAEVGLVGGARRKGEPFSKMHVDFAASLQAALERIVLHVLRHFRASTGQRNLCLAGGVAHNCSLNGKILSAGLFDRVFVQPAAHDAGGAFGAALAASSEGRDLRPETMTHVSLGTAISNGGAREVLDWWAPFIEYERVEDVASATAALIARGNVIGWVQGRAEFGPRALGNRSILADPRPASNKDRINRMVKKREAYRPFAPSVLEERAAKYFDLSGAEANLSFMGFAVQVRPEVRSCLGGITHVDGTARIQTVSKDTNPLYWRLLREFEIATGMPIVLNTSFNNNAEPIVNSVEDAIVCFLTTGIDVLAVGEYLVRRKSREEIRSAALTLAPALPFNRKLVKRARAEHPVAAAPEAVFEIESTKSAYFGKTSVEISSRMYSVLRQADGATSLGALLAAERDEAEPGLESAIDEAFDLWTARIITLKPAGATAALNGQGSKHV